MNDVDPIMRAVGLAFFAFLGAWIYFDGASEERLAKTGQSFAKRNLAWIEPELARQFDRRAKQRNNALAVGFLALGTYLSVFVDYSEAGFRSDFSMLLTVAMLVSVLSLVHFWQFAQPYSASSESRTAHVREIEVADLVSPRSRVISYVSFAIISGMLGLLVALRAGGWWFGPLLPWWILTGSAVLFLAVNLTLWVAARFLVRYPQPAHDEASLYFQDAVRAEALEMVFSFGTVCLYVWMLSAQSELSRFAAHLPTWGRLGLSFFWAVPTALFLAMVWSAWRAYRVEPWFRHRLWPQLAPGEVLRPDSHPMSHEPSRQPASQPASQESGR